MKRYLIIISTMLVAAAAGFILFTKDEITFTKETSVYKAIPINTPFFVEIKSIKSIPFENKLLQEFKNAGTNILNLSQLEKLDTLIKNNNDVANSLRNDPFIVAYGFAGRNTPVSFFIKKAESNHKKKALEQLLAKMFPVKNFIHEKRNYNGVKINSLLSSQSEGIHYCFAGGLFLASTRSILVEQAIRQLSTQSIASNKYFSIVNKTVSEQSEISWYFNHEYIPAVLSNWLNNKSLETNNEFGEKIRVNYQKRVADFGRFASWSELDTRLEENTLVLNGITAADDSLHHYLSVFNQQEPVRFLADRVLPKNTSVFISYSFSDKEKFFTNLENFFSYLPNYYNREDKIKKIESGLRVNFREFFQNLVKNEAILAITNIPAETEQKHTLFLIETEGKLSAEDELNRLINGYAQRNNLDPANLKTSFVVDSETKYTMYKFPYPSLPGLLLGAPFTYSAANYVSFNDNFLVFSNTKEALEDYLQNMVLKSTLSKDINYLKFKENMVSRGNINVFVNLYRSFNLNREIFNNDVAATFDKHNEVLGNFYAANWQVVAEKNIFFNTLNIAFNEKGALVANTAWQSNLGAQINFKPQIVKNHDNPANNEIIVQDEMNNLHLVTKDGRTRWTIPVSETILSEIHQIDLYKNGKLQYLFNTKNKLYLIDRNGNNVAQFPISFRSPATNGVNVFDYDNNRNYRYFVACEDKKIYAYDTEGKIVTGWNFNQTDNLVTTPIQFFRVEGKDYIVFKDKSRIYIQNRKGETRVKTPVAFENSRNKLVLNLNGTPKIVATDATGKVYYLYFNGNYSEIKTGNFGKNHFFTVDDLDGNGKPDFIFIDENELTVMHEDGKKMFSKKLESTILHPPNIYTFATGKKIGVVDRDDNRIFLFEPSGNQHPGFPLRGNSEFSIGQLEQNSGLCLLVGSEGGDLYNYSLD